MKITCENCTTKYDLSDDLIKKAVIKVRCTKCGHIFEVLTIENTDKNGCRVITVCNQKGGVAKTSTCLNLGFSMTGMRKKVLLIDFDVQASLTILLGHNPTHSFYDIIRNNKKDLNPYIVKTRYPGLYLLPSASNLVLLNKKFFGKKHFEYMLKSRLKALKHQFDYILIDTPPSIEFYTLNALTASDLAVIPGQCDYLSTHGINQISGIIDMVRKKNNPGLSSRVLVTMFNAESAASGLIFSKLSGLYKDKMLKTIVGFDEKLRESQIMSQPALHYDRKSSAGSDYLHLAKEISEIAL